MRISLLLPLIAAAILECACASFDLSGGPQNDGFDNLVKSVVKIDVWEKSQKDGGSLTVRSIGSGVIMDSDGTILTNAHVVNCYATKIIVTLANLERVKAEFIGWDHWTDLALIRLDMADIKSAGFRSRMRNLETPQAYALERSFTPSGLRTDTREPSPAG